MKNLVSGLSLPVKLCMNILRNGFNRFLFMLQLLYELPMNSPYTEKDNM